MVKELLESFVGMQWVKHIDFSKAEPIDKSYVNEQYKKYEADIIYRLQFRHSELYLYLLIEFQSTVDKFIAFRMLQYIVELYRELIYHHKVKKLPVVFPILIYNGEKKWTAPLSLEDCIDVPKILNDCKQYLPHFKYFPIIENEFSFEKLEQMKNAIATVFLLETGDDRIFYKTIDRINDLLYIYSKKNEFFLIRTLLYWLMHYLQNQGIINSADEITALINTPEEAETMLARTLKKIKEDLRKEGFNEGIQKGIQKGMKRGVLMGVEKERIKIARNLLKQGMDEASIIKITSLKKEQLLQLKKQR